MRPRAKAPTFFREQQGGSSAARAGRGSEAHGQRRAALRLEGPWKELGLFLGAKQELAQGLEQGSGDLLCVGIGPV